MKKLSRRISSSSRRATASVFGDHDGPTRNQLQFSLDLLKAVNGLVKGNIFFSPVNIAEALCMVFEGAYGNTRNQIAIALRQKKAAKDPRRMEFPGSNVFTALQHVGGIGVINGSSQLFVDENVTVSGVFKRILQDKYDQTLTRFTPTTVGDSINYWSAETTKNLMTELVSPETTFDAKSLMMCSASYIRGNWEHKFDRNVTVTFNGQRFMTGEKLLPFFENEDYKVLEMPYVGDRLSFIVILPGRKMKTLDAVLAKLDSSRLRRILRRLKVTHVHVECLKFKLQEYLPVQEALQALGITELFSPNEANLSKITKTKRLYCSHALHKATIVVCETGSCSSDIHCSRTPDMPNFVTTLPFLFLIYDKSRKLVLFFGKVVEPTVKVEIEEEGVENEKELLTMRMHELRDRLSSEADAMYANQHQFSLELFQAACARVTPSQNVFLSPISVSIGLCMVAEGSRGNTLDQLIKSQMLVCNPTETGRCNELALKRAHRFHRNLMHSLSIDPNVQVYVSNRVFIETLYEPLDSYLRSLMEWYGSEVIKFPVENGWNVIDQRVSYDTRGKITHACPIGEMSMYTTMLVVTVIHFYAQWETVFNEDRTKLNRFHYESGKCTEAWFMHMEKLFPYTQQSELKCRVVSMAFKDNRFSLVTLLPDEGSSVDDLITALTQIKLQRLLTGLRPTRLRLAYPKCTIKVAMTATDILKELGITNVFQPEVADLSGIQQTIPPLHLSHVCHKAVLRINERGAEGTSGSIARESVILGDQQPAISFEVNRPFLVLVLENWSRTVLFVGKIVKPSFWKK